MAIEGSGSKLVIEQEMLFDDETSYIESVVLGTKTQILQSSGVGCIKEAGQEWRREPLLDIQDSPRTGGGILADLNSLSYELLQRLPDSRTDDGKETFVIQGTMDEGTLRLMSDSIAQQAVSGPQSELESMTMVVHIEQDSLKVRTILFELEYLVDAAPLAIDMQMSIDGVNEPIGLPDEVPETCPGSTL